jgi:ribosomal protein RSM22 (predicted rRNA methylase)
LDEAGGRLLRQAIEGADAVLWVEPGTYADSRTLVAMREELCGTFTVVAPCTHQQRCGLLAAGNERHWCHHFATPPAGIMADADWVRFAQRAGIDLRRLPYSYLVLDRRRPPGDGSTTVGVEWSRVLGTPRIYKGFAKILRCREEGVGEVELQKRESPELYRAFKKGDSGNLFRWREEGVRVREAQAWSVS